MLRALLRALFAALLVIEIPAVERDDGDSRMAAEDRASGASLEQPWAILGPRHLSSTTTPLDFGQAARLNKHSRIDAQNRRRRSPQSGRSGAINNPGSMSLPRV